MKFFYCLSFLSLFISIGTLIFSLIVLPFGMKSIEHKVIVEIGEKVKHEVVESGAKVKPNVVVPVPSVVIVDSTAGWQDSGIELKQNDTVHIEVSGRIHLAIRQIIHLAEFAKPLMLENMKDDDLKKVPGLSVEQLRHDYPRPVVLDSLKTFYRQWIGPEGEESKAASSDMLDRCRIFPNEAWGKLFVTVFPKEFIISARRDPVAVMNEATQTRALELKNVSDVISDNILQFHTPGKLAFIINEAVISPYSPPKYPECEQYYKALFTQAKQRKDDKHKIDPDSIPLIWFADNVGSFSVKVRVEPASTSPQMGVETSTGSPKPLR